MAELEPLSRDALAYVALHAVVDEPVLAEVDRETAALGKSYEMQVAPAEGALLTFLARLVGARRVLEVGTFMGYGAISLARGLAEGGRLLCLELDPERAATARRNLERAGIADRVEVRVGPAAESLAALPAEPTFDLVFLDADKGGYPAYVELILPRMVPGGLLVIDNVLMGGRVFDPEREDPDAEAVDALNGRLRDDPRVDSVMLPVADGITLVRRRA